jgi:hypothetical protein
LTRTEVLTPGAAFSVGDIEFVSCSSISYFLFRGSLSGMLTLFVFKKHHPPTFSSGVPANKNKLRRLT